MFLIIIPLFSRAQPSPLLPGAEAAALGNSAVGLSNVWAIQNNIGALAPLESPQLAFGYNTRLGIQELTTFGGLIAYPIQNGNAAAAFTRYGTGKYSLQSIGIGYSHRISYMSVGIKINYLQQSIETVGSDGSLVIEAGGKAELSNKLHFAAHVYNISQSRLQEHNEELIPVVLKAGLSYLPTSEAIVLLQILKDVDQPSRFSAGLAYRLIEELELRSGIMTNPIEASFGLGFKVRRIAFDYAFRHHTNIGAAHHLSVGYSLHKVHGP